MNINANQVVTAAPMPISEDGKVLFMGLKIKGGY